MSQTTQTPSDPSSRLDVIFRKAIAGAMSEEGEFDPVIRPAQNPKFGDYQCNAAMALGKARRIQPRELAERIVDQVESDELIESMEVAGPGFINITLSPSSLGALLQEMSGPELGVVPTGEGHVIAVDLCGVNVAKQMHVGHLRSTIIGDTLALVWLGPHTIWLKLIFRVGFN